MTTDVGTLRASLGWSQAKLADCLGCNQTTIDRLEGGQPPRGPMVLVLARLDRLAAGHALQDMSVADVRSLLVDQCESKPVSPLLASA